MIFVTIKMIYKNLNTQFTKAILLFALAIHVKIPKNNIFTIPSFQVLEFLAHSTYFYTDAILQS